MRFTILATIVGGLTVYGAVASNIINEHSGYYQEGVEYSILQSGGNDVGVLILKDSVWSRIWKFEAYDSVTGAPGYINYIRIQPTGDVGYIRLRIVGAAGHVYGAQDVKKIDLLTNADNTTTLYSVYISGDLGTDDAVRANHIGDVSGSGGITVGGDLLHALSATNDINCSITINGDLLDGIYGDTMKDVTVNGAGPHTGDISIGGSYSDDITINGNYNGDLIIDAVMDGVTTLGTLSGSMTVGQNL